MVEIARIALRAGHSSTSTGAGILAIPRRVGMVFTYPASVLAKDAGHRQTFCVVLFSASPCAAARSSLSAPRATILSV
jgi:hypothetical protein